MDDRTRFRSTAGLTVVLVLVVVGLLAVRDPGRFSSLLDLSGPSTPSTAPSSDRPGPAPAAAPEPGVDPGSPFTGSPAAAWQDGIAGLTLPPAVRTGRFSAKEVDAALDLSRGFAAAKRLDPEAIGGASPATLLGLIDPKSRTRDDVRSWLENPSENHDPSSVITRFDPRESRLQGSVVKVLGTAALSTPTPEELQVTMDFSVVYAVRKVGSVRPEVTRVHVRDRTTLSFFHDRETTPGKVWVAAWTAENSGVFCNRGDGFIHPMYDSDVAANGAAPAGKAKDPYDTRGPVAADLECGTATRV